MRLVHEVNGAMSHTSLAYMPPEQNGTLEDRYYDNSTPVILDKAGSGSGSSSSSIIRSGALPVGYYGADKVLVRKRIKVLTIGEDFPDMFSYFVQVRDRTPGVHIASG
jgi:hypothetical protein